MKPTSEELDFASTNIDRLEAESLDRDEFPKQRARLAQLKTWINQ